MPTYVKAHRRGKSMVKAYRRTQAHLASLEKQHSMPGSSGRARSILRTEKKLGNLGSMILIKMNNNPLGSRYQRSKGRSGMNYY